MKDQRDKRCRFIFIAILIIFTRGATNYDHNCMCSEPPVLFLRKAVLQPANMQQICSILSFYHWKMTWYWKGVFASNNMLND